LGTVGLGTENNITRVRGTVDVVRGLFPETNHP
jgi:hypothetical protein